MHQQTIVVSLVGVVLVSAALLLPRTWTVVAPTPPALVQPSASGEVPKEGIDPSGQPFEEIQSVTQRFADELGRFKEAGSNGLARETCRASKRRAHLSHLGDGRSRPGSSTPRRFTLRRNRASWSSVEFTSATNANIGTSAAPADL